MGILCGLAPWIVYWVLVGNVPFAAAAVTALVVAALSLVLGRINRAAPSPLEIGSIGTFLVVTILTLALNESFLAWWILPVSIIGLFVVALAATLTGKALAGESDAGGPSTDETRSELVGQLNTRVTQVWAAASAGMAVSSVVPPIALSNNGIADPESLLVIIFSWVIPFVVFTAGIFVSRVLEDRMTARLANPETVRRTTFVAFRELAIDELFYLAREKAEREVGAGMEAYDVKLGSLGVTLTGDESRESWPATYKVRARR